MVKALKNRVRVSELKQRWSKQARALSIKEVGARQHTAKQESK